MSPPDNQTDSVENAANDACDLPSVPHPIPTSEYFPRTSRAGLAVIVLLCFIFFLTSLHPLHHTDLWGHLCFGRWIVENGQLPLSDPFLAAEQTNGVRIVNVPWLSQIIGYKVFQGIGLEGLVLGHALLITLACGIVITSIGNRNVHITNAIGGGVAMYLLALPSVGGLRPQLLGVPSFGLVLCACAKVQYGRQPLYWLPVVFLLWANLHDSFLLGLGVLGLSAMGTTLERYRSSPNKSKAMVTSVAVRQWIMFLVCLMASCANPLGPRILLAVNLFDTNPILVGNFDGRPMEFISFGGVMFFCSVVITSFVVRRSNIPFEITEVVLLIVFAALSLLSTRMLIWWALVWPWVLSRHTLSVFRLPLRRENDLVYPNASQDTMRTLFAIVSVFVTLLWSPPTYALFVNKPRGLGAATQDDTPLYISDQILRRKLNGLVFCPMDWADYLLWQTEGSVVPMVYSRAPSAHSSAWADYLLLSQGVPQWREIADHYDLEYLVLSRDLNDSLRRQAQRHSRCEVLYQDRMSLLIRLLPREQP